jgi:hypothetical protein
LTVVPRGVVVCIRPALRNARSALLAPLDWRCSQRGGPWAVVVQPISVSKDIMFSFVIVKGPHVYRELLRWESCIVSPLAWVIMVDVRGALVLPALALVRHTRLGRTVS